MDLYNALYEMSRTLIEYTTDEALLIIVLKEMSKLIRTDYQRPELYR